MTLGNPDSGGHVRSDYRRGIDDVSVGEIFPSAMRESDVSQQGDHYWARIANRYLPNSPDPRLRASLMWPKFGAGGFYRAS
jgi:hypothetical protein